MNQTNLSLIDQARQLPSENRAETLKSFVEQVRELKTCSNIVLARVLWEIDNEKYYEGWKYEKEGVSRNYSSIAEYAKEVFEYSKSTTQTFLRIHEKFVRKLQVPEERLAGISWGNLKIVCPHVNEDNLDFVLKLCEKRQKEVKEWADQFDDEDSVKSNRYCFTCSESQAEIFDNGLDVAREQIAQMGGNPPTDAQVYEYVFSQFLMIEQRPLTLQDYLTLLENRFDVQLGLREQDAPIPKNDLGGSTWV